MAWAHARTQKVKLLDAGRPWTETGAEACMHATRMPVVSPHLQPGKH